MMSLRVRCAHQAGAGRAPPPGRGAMRAAGAQAGWTRQDPFCSAGSDDGLLNMTASNSASGWPIRRPSTTWALPNPEILSGRLKNFRLEKASAPRAGHAALCTALASARRGWPRGLACGEQFLRKRLRGAEFTSLRVGDLSSQRRVAQRTWSCKRGR